MPERVIVFQTHTYETFFWALDPQEPETDVFRPVEQINGLTPYGMLLASLGTSTAQALHSYARKHGIGLEHVELHLECGTPFLEGSEETRGNGKHKGNIRKQLVLYGTLTPEERDRLLRIANQYSILKLVEDGTGVKSLQAVE